MNHFQPSTEFYFTYILLSLLLPTYWSIYFIQHWPRSVHVSPFSRRAEKTSVHAKIHDPKPGWLHLLFPRWRHLLGANQRIAVRTGDITNGSPSPHNINPDENRPGVHYNLTTEFLRDKPKFVEIFEQFRKYNNGAEEIIMPFDLKFLNSCNSCVITKVAPSMGKFINFKWESRWRRLLVKN